MMKTQVVIVGAGPTGLSMAAQLFRYHIDCIIIEKNAATTPLSKALVVQARTLEIFQELGIVEKAIGMGEIATALNIFRQGKQIAHVNINGLGQGLSAYPFVLSLEQSKTEQLLVDYLAEKGKQVKWGHEFIRCEQNDRAVIVSYKDDKGQEQTIEAAYLVGCDGAASATRNQLGLPFEGSTDPKLFYVADTILKSPVVNKNELFINMIPKGFVLFFPMEGTGHYRIVGTMPMTKGIEKEYVFADILPAIGEIVYPVEFEAVNWFSTYKIHSRKAATFMKGRCFIAGDAAHIHTPAGGQGMNTGIQDAYNLAWKIAYALRGELNAGVLDTYNTERTANARTLLRTTDRMFDLLAGSNRYWNFIRLNFLPTIIRWIIQKAAVQKRIFPRISQTGIAYPDSDLTVKSSVGKVSAGDRMPYFVFTDGSSIFSYLTDPVFKLIYFSDEDKPAPEIITRPIITLAYYQFQDIPRSLFGEEDNFYVLLRPDNHISYIGRDIDKCREFLNHVMRSAMSAVQPV